jgi:hypothetical protein
LLAQTQQAIGDKAGARLALKDALRLNPRISQTQLSGRGSK